MKYIRDPRLTDRVVTAKDAASWIKDGMTLGLSGFTRAGDAKAVPTALIERTKKESLKVNVYTGASLGSDIDKLMAEAGMIHKRMPFQADPTMRKKSTKEKCYLSISICPTWRKQFVRMYFARLISQLWKRLQSTKTA